jgi:hypothetical protein
MSELDEAMDAIPDLTEAQVELLIAFQIEELAKYTGKAPRKKDQSEDEVEQALTELFKTSAPAPKTTGFKRRF